MNEFDIIKNYFEILTKKNSNSLDLNDDVFFDKKKKLVISVDTYVENIHFVDFKNPDLVIKKIIRSSISDLICKGVTPRYYFISASGNKKTFSKSNLLKINKSLKKEQNKYNIFLSGGDTVFSNKLSFTITTVGFSDRIIYRNNAKINDDIYVSGNLGDSYMGLMILKNKIKFNRLLNKYFINQYFAPQIQLKMANCLKSFANTSVDISDGLFSDLDKLINRQKLSFLLHLKNIPVSSALKKVLIKKKLSKINYISRGDDYQILFTASQNKRRIIKKISNKLGLRITKIGKIQKNDCKSMILDHKNLPIELKSKGYFHNF